jgi:hypothetical protein
VKKLRHRQVKDLSKDSREAPCYVTQTGLKLKILLTLPPECWDYRCMHLLYFCYSRKSLLGHHTSQACSLTTAEIRAVRASSSPLRALITTKTVRVPVSYGYVYYRKEISRKSMPATPIGEELHQDRIGPGRSAHCQQSGTIRCGGQGHK